MADRFIEALTPPKTASAVLEPPAHTPAYDRMTPGDLGLMLRLRKQGLTQVEIAQRLGCSQPTSFLRGTLVLTRARRP